MIEIVRATLRQAAEGVAALATDEERLAVVARAGDGRYVLHTRHESFVCVGEYDSKDDPRLLALQKQMANLELKDQKTGQDGWLQLTVTPERDFPELRPAYSVQFFVKAFRQGDPELAGVAGYRLVQAQLG